MQLRIHPLDYLPNSDTVEVKLKRGTEIIDLQSDIYETVIICHEPSDVVETNMETRNLVFVKEGNEIDPNTLRYLGRLSTSRKCLYEIRQANG